MASSFQARGKRYIQNDRIGIGVVLLDPDK